MTIFISRMHFPALIAVLFLALIFGARAAENQVLWPGRFTPALRASGKAFQVNVVSDAIDIDFTGITNKNANEKGKGGDYILIDLGPASALRDYLPGGYLEVTVNLDKPILRVAFELGDPSDFWGTRIFLEENAPMDAGGHPYRFYLDSYPADRVASGKDHLYLNIRGPEDESGGTAHAQITSVSLSPQTADWETEKARIYKDQFHLLSFDKIEPLYYFSLDKAVDWAPIASDPFLRRFSLDGSWAKTFVGEKTWDYKYLATENTAQTDFADGSWTQTEVPEKPVVDQKGGYYWYRREIDVPADFLKGRIYLRCDDLSEDGRIYVNGKLAGSQTSVLEEWNWIVGHGSRLPDMKGHSTKEMMISHYFKRSGIPFPFDIQDIPDNAKRAYLPIFSGEYQWPYAYDVTGLLKPGRNVIAVRIYGNPMGNWWIYKNRDDRAAHHVFGLLGSMCLAATPDVGLLSLDRVPPEKVDHDGTAVHGFDCVIYDPVGSAAQVRFLCQGAQKDVPVVGGKVHAEFSLPACFASYEAKAVLLDGSGTTLDQRKITFNGAVVDIKDRVLRVNGEPFQVRGTNFGGPEWEKGGRGLTREGYSETLRFYQQEGINAIRCENPQQWQMEEAFKAGMMILASTDPASCDYSIMVLGDLQNPDYRLRTDRHRILASLIGNAPNVLLWQGANEIHHTSGYQDREVVQKLLATVHDAFRERDAAHRPVTFSNLDTVRQNWFFYDGQDIVGWNSYFSPESTQTDAEEVFRVAGDKPVIFTEWDTKEGDRAKNVASWETAMRKKWKIISTTPGSAGGFLFPHNGEYGDERGRDFIRDLFLPFSFTKGPDGWSFLNKTTASMREVSLTFLAEGADVPQTRSIAEIKAGESLNVDLPEAFTGTVEIRYDTHHGLKHFITQHFPNPISPPIPTINGGLKMNR